MTRPTTTAIDDFIGQIKSAKINMVTASVVEGISSRLIGKGTITPKQAWYIVERYKKQHNNAVPGSMAKEILAVMEKGGTQDQQIAEKAVRDELETAKTEANVSHFNNLFEMEDVRQLVRNIDTNIQQLKSKIGA